LHKNYLIRTSSYTNGIINEMEDWDWYRSFQDYFSIY